MTSTATMLWSPQQEAALKDIATWLGDRDRQVFYLAGFAGTGKTTIAREVANMVTGRVLYAAFTGKAASVLRTKGCDNASTLHSLIYRCEEYVEEGRRKLHFVLNQDSELGRADVLILDECSMVNEKLGADVVWFGTKILVLGDPAQLPPVEGTGFFTSSEPDLLLTEIHRQAADNPIIRYATMARQNQRLPWVSDGRFRRLRRTTPDALARAGGAGQVLVGTHRSRKAYNMAVRCEAGRTRQTPEEGEVLVALRNAHDLGIYNGTLWTVTAPAVETEDGLFCSISDGEIAHDHLPITMGPPELAARGVLPVDFGYALTVHKAQGSEWPTVTLWDDGFGSWPGAEPGLRSRWIYTAITRAQEQMTVYASGY